ncbi:MAG TPA: IS630 family transposase [Candidatus Sumerlaeota bacterium]|nr:IS630 family transposase [Candidatus Sumerlaeota bacterium]
MVSDFENPVRSSPSLTLQASRHIKKLRRLARRKGIDLWCEDECHFQQHGSRCAMWVPPEETDPVLLHAPTRRQAAVFGAVCPADGRLLAMSCDTFNAQTFQVFLAKLLRRRRRGCKMVVIVDNARWHHAKAISPWLYQHRHVLRLDFLPPYSPDLNPVERVWKLTRRLCTHNRYFKTLQDLTEVVQEQFTKWFQPNLTIAPIMRNYLRRHVENHETHENFGLFFVLLYEGSLSGFRVFRVFRG